MTPILPPRRLEAYLTILASRSGYSFDCASSASVLRRLAMFTSSIFSVASKTIFFACSFDAPAILVRSFSASESASFLLESWM